MSDRFPSVGSGIDRESCALQSGLFEGLNPPTGVSAFKGWIGGVFGGGSPQPLAARIVTAVEPWQQVLRVAKKSPNIMGVCGADVEEEKSSMSLSFCSAIFSSAALCSLIKPQ